MIYLGDIPMKNAARFPDDECVVFEGTRLTWKAFNDRINRLANGLQAKGYRPGEHVAVLLENCHQYLEIYYALAKLGLVTVPLNYRLSDQELIYIINHSEATALMAGGPYLDTARRLKPNLGKIREFISVEQPAEGMTFYEDVLKGGALIEPDWERLDENDMVILMYTGGTTGTPKGVMLSHRNLMAAFGGITMAGAAGGPVRGFRTLFILPLFHIANWQAFCFQLQGGSVVINRRPDVNEIIRLILEEKPVNMNLVPAIYQFMLQMPGIEKMDFSHIRSLSFAGAPMPIEVWKKCIQVFGNKFGQGYGLTEAAPTVSTMGPDDYDLDGPLSYRLKSVGREALNVRVKIRREDETVCAPGEIGEITVFGKNVMLGYWKDPEQTRKAVRNGWLYTGDVGYLDEEGYIYLVDRKHDMIISGGENVYPNEVENVLYQHPAVLEAAVIGVPDEKWGEAVKAVVSLKLGQTATEAEIIAFVRKQIAGYKTPKSVEFMTELPKTTVGKISRRVVREKYWAGKDRRIN